MGAGSSSQSLVDDPFLGIFISKKSLSDIPNEKVIDTVASYQWLPAFTRSREKFIEDRIAVHLKSFILNENETHNFSRFLKMYNSISTASLLTSTTAPAAADADKTAATKRDKFLLNAIQIIRYSAKVLIENLTEEEFILRCSRYRTNQQIPSTDRGGLETFAERRADIEFLANLTRLIVDKQQANVADNYPLLFESVSTLIVFFSTTLFKTTPAESSEILFSYIEHDRVKQMYAAIIKVLCTFYIDATPVPSKFTNDGSSLLFGLASGLWGLLASSDSEDVASPLPPLANRAQLLLLILVSSYPTEMNLFSRALFGLGNVDDPLYSSGHIVSYSKLWSKIGSALGDAGDERSLLMLYFMLLGNTNFKSFIISRQNMPTLVLPLLRVLYNAATLKTHQVYLASIALLILSQDDTYNRLLSEVELLKTPLGREGAVWYAERNIPAMTLGSFVYLNLIRAISVNLSQTRDRYLHSNCLAALANMSAETRRAHSLPMQRMVSLFEQLAKRYRRLSSEINDRLQPSSAAVGDQSVNGNGVTHQNGYAGANSADASAVNGNNPHPHEAEQIADLGVLEELLRMILEVINGILQHQINDNPHLIHTILYKREVFHQFRTHPSFSDVVQNLENIIQYFLAQVEKNSNNISGADDVVRIITANSKAFPVEQQLKKFPKLHFKFVEEQNSCEFFAPYCWKLVTLNVMHWPQHKILLFNALDEPLGAGGSGGGGGEAESGGSDDYDEDDDDSEREIEIVQETKKQVSSAATAAPVRK